MLQDDVRSIAVHKITHALLLLFNTEALKLQSLMGTIRLALLQKVKQ
jgi:hypothetical protein